MKSFARFSFGSSRTVLGFTLAAVTALLIPQARCFSQTAVSMPTGARSAAPAPPSIVQHVTESNQRLDMTVNTSRILTLGKNIRQVNINNPSILGHAALSPTQLQVFARTPGSTQVNLWDDNDHIYTIDVTVFGDVRELAEILQAEFPTASLRVRAIANGVLISGYVETSDQVPRIISVAEEYYPQVVDNIQVGGVNQVLLHVKVIEVSRTKLRAFGFDWWQRSSGGTVASNASNLLGTADVGTSPPIFGGNATLGFTIFDGLNSFYGVIEALCEDNVAKVWAEPTLVTYNGRPARFLSGGQVPVQSGGGLGVPSNIQYRDYGVVLDFVPIVLGNGRIRLEVRPSVSEIDETRSYGNNPAFKTREADTGLELRAGQTLAIAGILQTLSEAERRGIPFIADVPYLGALFRRVETRQNELELLILVTPELVSAMDADQVPQCGPGMDTKLPSTWDLMARGHIEVPDCCSECGGYGCDTCQGRGYRGEVAKGHEPGMVGMPAGPLATQGAHVLKMSEIPKPPVERRATIALPVGGPVPSERFSTVAHPMQPPSGPAMSAHGAAVVDPRLPTAPTPPGAGQLQIRELPRMQPPTASATGEQTVPNPSLRSTSYQPPRRDPIEAPRAADGTGSNDALRGRLTSSFDMTTPTGPGTGAVTPRPPYAPPGFSPTYQPPGPLPQTAPPHQGTSENAAAFDTRPPSETKPVPSLPPMIGPIGYDPALR